MEETKEIQKKCHDLLMAHVKIRMEIVLNNRLSTYHDLSILHKRDWDMYHMIDDLVLDERNKNIVMYACLYVGCRQLLDLQYEYEYGIVYKYGGVYENLFFHYVNKEKEYMIEKIKQTLSVPYWNALNEASPLPDEMNTIIFSYIYEKDPHADTFDRELEEQKEYDDFEDELDEFENDELDEFEEME